MSELIVSPEYQCYPTWWKQPKDDVPVNVDPVEVGLSADVVDKLNSWGAWYESTYNSENPVDSGFEPPHLEDEFERVGLELAGRAAVDLGTEHVVVFRYRGRTHLISPSAATEVDEI